MTDVGSGALGTDPAGAGDESGGVGPSAGRGIGGSGSGSGGCRAARRAFVFVLAPARCFRIGSWRPVPGRAS
ncbi:MAG: hypothetical protein J0H98_03700 [Solirubrobacterales bacterium]|nr:hypothetical protein [Solirubrobacterales bacterium]